MTNYQRDFERLCNKVIDLTPTAILNCFISGLKVELQHEIAILRPATISQAIGLAKRVESKIQASRAHTQAHHCPPPPKYTPSLVPTPTPHYLHPLPDWLFHPLTLNHPILYVAFPQLNNKPAEPKAYVSTVMNVFTWAIAANPLIFSCFYPRMIRPTTSPYPLMMTYSFLPTPSFLVLPLYPLLPCQFN